MSINERKLNVILLYIQKGRRVIGISGTLIWSKTLMELIFNPCSEFRWSPEGPVSQIHSLHLLVGAPGIFPDLLRFVQMLKREWVRKATGIYRTYSSQVVHRCGPGGRMRARHAAGPGSIPGRDKFPAWGFFLGFSSPVRQMSGSFMPPRSPSIICPSLSSSIIIHYGRKWPEMLTRPKVSNEYIRGIYIYIYIYIYI